MASLRKGDKLKSDLRRLALIVGFCLLAVACSGSEEDTNSLEGTWENSEDGTTITFNEDATFTFESGPIFSAGTYETDAGELTFTFTENSNEGCVGATITWEYQLDGDSMTAETIGDECTNAVGSEWDLSRM